MARNNVYLYYRNTQRHETQVRKLIDVGTRYGLNVVQDHRQANIIVSIGGDGAFLQAARFTGFRDDAIYVGFAEGPNSFYCDFDINDLSAVEAIFKATGNRVSDGEIEVRRYPLLEASINGGPPMLCLNECSVKSSIIKSLAIEVYINDFLFETFRGDGMVISTPTGSTAYNKSLSGAIVDPLIHCLQVSEIASVNNNRYRTLGSAFLLNRGRKLSLRIIEDGNDYPIIGMDNEALSLTRTDSVDIQLSEKELKTVKLTNNTFWHKIQRSFL